MKPRAETAVERRGVDSVASYLEFTVSGFSIVETEKYPRKGTRSSNALTYRNSVLKILAAQNERLPDIHVMF